MKGAFHKITSMNEIDYNEGAVKIEDPVEGKLWTSSFVKITTINFLLFCSFHMLVPTFPLYLKSLGGTDMIVGIAAGLFSAAGLVSRLYSGWLLDNKSRSLPFIIGLLIMIFCPLAFIIVTPILWILVIRFFQGFGFSMGNTSSSTSASDILPKNHFSEGLGIFGVSSSISLSIAPAFGIFIMESFGYQALFLCSFLLALISFILTLQFKTKVINKEKKKFDWKNDIINRAAIPASITMFFAITPYGAVNNFVSLYAIEKGFTHTGVFFILLAVSAIIFRVSTGKIIDRKSINIMYFVAIPSFFASILILSTANNELVFLLSAILFGIGFGSITPVLLTKALKSIPLVKRGSANSTYFLSFDLGMGLGGFIAGALSDLIGYSHMYMSLLVLYLISFILYMRFLYEKPLIETKK